MNEQTYHIMQRVGNSHYRRVKYHTLLKCTIFIVFTIEILLLLQFNNKSMHIHELRNLKIVK
jgi:hypothetical protein